MPVTVLYEDDWGLGGEFTLHHFVSQCVIDRLRWNRSLFEVRKTNIQGVPVGGDSALRQKCQRDLKKLSNRFLRVFALYDDDKVTRLVSLPSGSCRPLICEHLKDRCEPADRLEIVLLHKNLETVIETIRDSGLTTIQDAILDKALQKNLAMRDRVFSHCAYKLSSSTRSQLLEQLPDLKRLVSRVAACFDLGSQG